MPITYEQRSPETFPAFPALPGEVGEALAAWLPATRIVPVSAIGWTWPDPWVIRQRTVTDVMWFYIRSGRGRCWLGDSSRAFYLKPGDLFLVPQAMRHAIRTERGESIEQISVHFFAHLYVSIDLIGALGLGGVYHSDADAPYGEVSEALARENALQPPAWQQAMSTHIWQVLFHLIRHELPARPAPNQAALYHDLHRLQPVLSYIEDRLPDAELRVAEVAQQLHVSEVSLRALFRRALGVSPVEFIRRQRVTRACTLLRATQHSIQHIAMACGFTDMPFFYRTFRQFINATPRDYREQGVL